MDSVFEPLQFADGLPVGLSTPIWTLAHMAPLSNAPVLDPRESETNTKPTIKNANIRAMLEDLAQVDIKRREEVEARSAILQQLAAQKAFPSLAPLLPLVLNLNGRPYDLGDHYCFSPLFRLLMPKNLVLKTGRQVSKSTSLASHGVVLSNCLPFFKTLYVTPLYEQIRRFSNNYVRRFIDESPVKALWTGTDTENNVLQRSFKNKSVMLFSFALLDADRVRGVSSDQVSLDEIQDLDPDHIPIIQETMSYSRYALTRMAGTPKSLDNPLEGAYRRSSAAEWFIPCHSCKHWNIPSIEHDLDKMIGPYNIHISEKYPGTVCAKCQKPINPRHGRWVHRYPDRRWVFAGYHVPQILLPLHFADPEKWSTLLMKREGWGNMTQAQFYNEVMGESIDAGQKLISETDLRKACVLPWKNKKEPDPACLENIDEYKHRMLAIDWGGGGEDGISFTVLAVLGFRPTGLIDVLWAKKLLIGGDHLAEARECMKYSSMFKCDFIAHDYTGAGTVRETVMVQAGANLDRVMAMRLVRSAAQDFILFKAPTPFNHRAHYSLDKTRSLLYTCQAIKLGQVRFFEYDWESLEQPGLIADFLALTENKTESRSGGDIYTITRNTLLSDDFAQAVNIGCAALWHVNDAVPNFAELAGVARLSARAEAAESPEDWRDDDMASRFLYGP